MAESPRRWLQRVRALSDPQARAAAGACFVEGIRAVLSADEAGLAIEALLVAPDRLRSPTAWEAVSRMQSRGVPRVELSPEQFARLSDMDNPVGLAAVVRWSPVRIAALEVPPDGLFVIAEDVGDAGNLGTLVRAADGAGAAGVVVCGHGADPAHRRCLRASLGTAFRVPVAVAEDGAEALRWAEDRGVGTVATSAHAAALHWVADYTPPLAVVVGSEERGLRPETLSACRSAVRIPMFGTAASLNVAVAAAIVMYESRRPGRANRPPASANRRPARRVPRR